MPIPAIPAHGASWDSWGAGIDAAARGAATPLTPTGTKTAAYTAAAGDLAMMNVAGGGTALTLPAAPADKAQVAYRAIGATSAAPLTVTRGGADTIGTTGATTTSIPLADETVVLQYDAPNTRWLAVSNVKTQASLAAALIPGTVVVKALGSGQDDGAQLTAAFAAATAVRLDGQFSVAAPITLPWTLKHIDFTTGSSIVQTSYTTSSKNNTLGLSLHPSDPHNAEDLVSNSSDDAYYRNYIFYRGGTLDLSNRQTLTVPIGIDTDTFIAPALPAYVAGGYVFIVSQDPTSFNGQGENQGFLRRIMAVTAVGDGTYSVRVDYKFPAAMTTTTVTGRSLEVTPVTLAPPVEIVGGDFSQANPFRMFSAMIRFEFCERPTVRDGVFHDGGWNAVQVVGCLGGSISGHAQDLLDDNDGSRYGYYSNPTLTQGHLAIGFTLGGPSRDVDFNVTATRTRHAFSTGPITNPHFGGDGTLRNTFNKYGEPESCTIRGHGWNTGGVTWDTHEQGWDLLFDSVVTTNAGRWANEGTADANEAGAGIDDRAKRTVWLSPRVINPAGSGIIVANVDRPGVSLTLAPTFISPHIIGAGSNGIRMEACAKIYNPTITRGGNTATPYGIQVVASASVSSVILGGRIDMESPVGGAYTGQCINVASGAAAPMVGGGLVFANCDRALSLGSAVSLKLPGDVIYENVNPASTRRWNGPTTVVPRKAHPHKPDNRVGAGLSTTTPLNETVPQQWLAGDEYFFTDVTTSGYPRGMVCTATGTPGTWVPLTNRTVVYYTGSAWPARPATAMVPAGQVLYISTATSGAAQPADMTVGDVWDSI